MSYQRALDILHLRSTELGQQENLDHPAWMEAALGWDPWQDPYRAYLDAYRALDVDWVIGIPRPHLAKTAFAHASSLELDGGKRLTEWGLSGSAWREEFRFREVEEVLGYDPLAEEANTDAAIEARALRRQAELAETQKDMGAAALVSDIHYTTLFQSCIMTFGWPLFLTAAGSAPERFQRVLEGFAEVSRRFLAVLARSHPPLVLVHDDIAMQRGLVFHPAWYRCHLFPLYERILEPLLAEPELRICFVSDGDYSAALSDLAALGFHGFFVNPNMNLAEIARTYGRDHFLVGNVDTAVLTFGTVEDVRREVARCVADARPCAGHFIKAMGDLPHNIPLDNLRAYWDACQMYHR